MRQNPPYRHPGTRIIALLIAALWTSPLLADSHESPPEMVDEEELLEELEGEQPETDGVPPLGPEGNKRGGTGHGGECPKPCTVPVF